VKDYFLNYSRRQTVTAQSRILARRSNCWANEPADWRVSLVDTGIWRNIGQRLLAVRHLVQDQEMFLANYSDGLTDAPLPDMINRFKKSGKIACFMAYTRRSPFIWRFRRERRCAPNERESGFRDMDQWRVFHFPEGDIRLHSRRDELVVQPFKRLIDRGELIAYRYEGFWRAMDTLRDRQVRGDD